MPNFLSIYNFNDLEDTQIFPFKEKPRFNKLRDEFFKYFHEQKQNFIKIRRDTISLLLHIKILFVKMTLKRDVSIHTLSKVFVTAFRTEIVKLLSFRQFEE